MAADVCDTTWLLMRDNMAAVGFDHVVADVCDQAVADMRVSIWLQLQVDGAGGG